MENEQKLEIKNYVINHHYVVGLVQWPKSWPKQLNGTIVGAAVVGAAVVGATIVGAAVVSRFSDRTL